MIKQLAWNTFKNTGDINTFMEFVQFKNVEQLINANSIETAVGTNANNIEGADKVNANE